jgi:hypothetical protein
MDYEYTVEDTRYEDHQYARYGTPTTAERTTERFEARDRLAVYYLPGTPEDGSTTRPVWTARTCCRVGPSAACSSSSGVGPSVK